MARERKERSIIGEERGRKRERSPHSKERRDNHAPKTENYQDKFNIEKGTTKTQKGK